MPGDTPDQHRALYCEVGAMLAELEAVPQTGDMAAAGQYLAILTRHIGPLRQAVDRIEWGKRADATIAALIEARADG